MAVEIERKFLTRNNAWHRQVYSSARIRQGYLVNERNLTVRVRVAGSEARLTLKGPMQGFSRTEYEYPIPVADADQMLVNLCQRPLIEKTRYWLRHGGHTWEIDVFEGDNLGLTVAEVELSYPDEQIELPEWIGKEVSNDPRYLNASLVRRPYRQW
ncbi:MAG: CYTH domain-containing protein [Candidatus Competibacterales bacterium]|nr:CYTH domain-containing protein [Candidatus Competibacterales bacterium]